MKQYVNLLNGKISSRGVSFDVTSPIDQITIGQGHQVSYDLLLEIFSKSFSLTNSPAFVQGTEKLAVYLQEHKNKFIEQILLETGYTHKDSEDIVDGSIELAANLNNYLRDTNINIPDSKFAYAHDVQRKLQILPVPYGIVAAMTPQNAPLILEITILLNAW